MPDIARRTAHARGVNCRPCGFTLVELLFTISILALLVTLFVPTLWAVRNRARTATCKHQLRGWGNAFAMYAAQNNGFYPHIDGLDRDSGTPDNFGWVDVLPPMMNEQPWRDHPRWKRPDVGTVFQCPSAELVEGARYGYQPKRDGFFSYAMNSCLELDENCYRAPGDKGRAMPSFLQTTMIVKPSKTILMFDQLLDPSRGYGGDQRNRSAGKYCGAYPKDFAVRHGGAESEQGGSILYCDYSVRWTETVWKDDWPAGMKCPPRDDENWFPYPLELTPGR